MDQGGSSGRLAAREIGERGWSPAFLGHPLDRDDDETSRAR
jgi:hypothetical protein